MGGSARPREAKLGGCGRPRLKWEAKVGGRSERPCEVGGRGRPCKAEVGGRTRPKWEAMSAVRGSARPNWEAMGGRSGRPCEAEVGGRARLWEAVGGRSGRPCSLIGSDRSHEKMWEAKLRGCETPNWEAVGGHVGGSARPCEAEVGGRG